MREAILRRAGQGALHGSQEPEQFPRFVVVLQRTQRRLVRIRAEDPDAGHDGFLVGMGVDFGVEDGALFSFVVSVPWFLKR